MRADLIVDILLVFAYLLVPGAGICAATRAVRSDSFLTFLAASFAVGFVATGLVSLALALIGFLEVVSLLVLVIAIGAVAWGTALRAGAPGELARGWARHARATPWNSAAAGIVLAGFLIARWTFPTMTNMGATAMRYWGDALEIADVGGIPAETLQWGSLLRPATSKSVLNTFNAGVSLLLDRGPLDSMSVLLFVVAVALLVVVIALFTELGIRWLSPAGALYLLANGVVGSELTADLTRNLAENWGRLVALGAVLLAVLSLRRARADEPDPPRRVRYPGTGPVVAGIVLGAAVGTHLVAAAVGALLIVSFALSQLLFRLVRRDALVRLVTIFGACAVIGTLVLMLPPGDLGFRGAGGDVEYRALRQELGLPASFDPTRFIVTGDGETVDEPVEVSDIAEAFAYRLMGRNAQVVLPGNELSTWALVLPSVVTLLILAGVVLLGPRDLRAAATGAAIAAAVLFLVAIAFALRYDLFALERFGNRRLFNYAMLPYGVVLLAGAESVGRAIAARGQRMERLVPVVSGLLMLTTAAWLLPAATWPHEARRERLAQQIAVLRWVGENVPCDGRILADRRTLGTFQVMTGHAAVLEGMGPHVRPAVLARAIGELMRGARYLRAPDDHVDFLGARGVAAVITTRPFAEFAGWGRVVKLKPNPFEDVASLRPAYRNSVATVYLVRDYRGNATLPSVEGRPGFRC